MILFGTNFNVYYLMIMRQFKKMFCIEEIRVYLALVTTATLIVFVNIIHMYDNVATALTDSFFQVASVVSTTGFGSADFDLWPSTAKFVLCFMMFMGACAGSTGGGIKVSRLVLLFKSIVKEIQSFIHPKIVKKVNMDKKPVDDVVLKSTHVFFATYVIIFIVSMFIVTINNTDLVTSFTAVLASLNNIGPGLGMVGPTCNYGFLSLLSKWTLVFDMLAGRLELFPMLIIFSPKLYKK